MLTSGQKRNDQQWNGAPLNSEEYPGCAPSQPRNPWNSCYREDARLFVAHDTNDREPLYNPVRYLSSHGGVSSVPLSVRVTISADRLRE